MATTSTTYFGNRARAAVVAAAGSPALANLFTVGRGFEVNITWDTAELYGTDSILRVDQAKHTLKAEAKLKGCKFNASVSGGGTDIWQQLMNSLYGGTSTGGAILDTNLVYLMDVYVYGAGSFAPATDVFAIKISDAYLEGLPIPFPENDFITLDLTFKGKTAVITNTAVPAA